MSKLVLFLVPTLLSFGSVAQELSPKKIYQRVSLLSELRSSKSAEDQDIGISLVGLQYDYRFTDIETIFVGILGGSHKSGNQTLSVSHQINEIYFGYEKRFQLPRILVFGQVIAGVSSQKTTSVIGSAVDEQSARPSVQFGAAAGAMTSYDAIDLFAKLGLRYDMEWDPKLAAYLSLGIGYSF